MFIATVLSVISIATVMLPSIFQLADTSIPGFNLLIRSHVILGITVLAVSVWILADWRFQKPGPTCFQRKNWMLGLSLVWTAQLIIGMLLFMMLYL